MFCSVIVASSEENSMLDKRIQSHLYTFQELLDLKHYKDLGICLHRNQSRFNKYNKSGRENWRHLLDDSHFYPSIITSAMQELNTNNQERIAA